MAKDIDIFKQTIQNYLTAMGERDEAFAQRLALPGKSIDECCKYIFAAVQRSGRQGFADSEIYGLAVHYYDEDDIKAEAGATPAHIVVNHTIELSPEEVAEARERAKEKLIQEEIARLRKPEFKPAPAAKPSPEKEPLLF